MLLHQGPAEVWFLKHICSPRGKVWQKIGDGIVEIKDNIPTIPMNEDGTVIIQFNWEDSSTVEQKDY